MTQPPHFEIETVIYFVTTRLRDNRGLLTENQAKIVQRTILDSADKNEFMLYAYVVMPNHVHILLRPINDGISKTIQLIKGRASRQINALREAKASPTPPDFRRAMSQGRGDFSRPINLWQKGFFDFTILSEKRFKEKFNYIHYNPVKWGLVEKAEDYKYSSAMEYKVKYGEVFYKQ